MSSYPLYEESLYYKADTDAVVADLGVERGNYVA